MADDIQYPQDTYSGGSAVMSATDSEGAKWSYDNDAGKWVNLVTGAALSPAEFSDHAGRGGNAAQGTMALAQAMRQEEASLMPPQRPAATPPPQAPAMATPIAPPQTGTQPMPQAPVMPPGGSPISPPQIDPAYRQRLMEQRPVPGTRTPPSPASIQSYNLQMYQRAVSQGMPQKQAAQIYLGPMLAAQGQSKPAPVPPHRDVAGVLYERNPTTGEWEAKTKPKIAPVKPEPRDPELQAELNDVRKRMFEVDKSVAKGDLTKEEGADLTQKYQDQLDELKDKYYKRPTNTPQRTFGRGVGVLKPEGASAPSAASSAPISPNNGGDVKAQALAAIKKGADANAVKARYKKLTGQDLE